MSVKAEDCPYFLECSIVDQQWVSTELDVTVWTLSLIYCQVEEFPLQAVLSNRNSVSTDSSVPYSIYNLSTASPSELPEPCRETFEGLPFITEHSKKKFFFKFISYCPTLGLCSYHLMKEVLCWGLSAALTFWYGRLRLWAYWLLLYFSSRRMWLRVRPFLLGVSGGLWYTSWERTGKSPEWVWHAVSFFPPGLQTLPHDRQGGIKERLG